MPGVDSALWCERPSVRIQGGTHIFGPLLFRGSLVGVGVTEEPDQTRGGLFIWARFLAEIICTACCKVITLSEHKLNAHKVLACHVCEHWQPTMMQRKLLLSDILSVHPQGTQLLSHVIRWSPTCFWDAVDSNKLYGVVHSALCGEGSEPHPYPTLYI